MDFKVGVGVRVRVQVQQIMNDPQQMDMLTKLLHQSSHS